jgi:hypothetical protein
MTESLDTRQLWPPLGDQHGRLCSAGGRWLALTKESAPTALRSEGGARTHPVIT